MKTRATTAVIVVAVVLIGWIAIWLISNIERVPIEGRSGYASEARNNRLLAAEMLFAAFGLKTRGFAHVGALPPISTTVLMPVSRRWFSLQRTEELGVWVESGGHLIVVGAPANEEGSNDPLLERFGVIGEYSHGEESFALASVTTRDGEEPLRVSFSTSFQLSTSEQPLASNESGIHAVSLHVGEGRLTVLSDYRFAQNRQIEDDDNAAFLWYLVTLEPRDSVWLFYGDDSASLWERIMTTGWQILASGLIVGVLMLWSAATRFGPVLPETAVSRRGLLEHIEASGRFLWKHDQGAALVDDLRHSLLSSMEFTHPGWSSSTEFPRRLSDLSGLRADVVRQALEAETVNDEHEFVNMIKTLETIRRHL